MGIVCCYHRFSQGKQQLTQGRYFFLCPLTHLQLFVLSLAKIFYDISEGGARQSFLVHCGAKINLSLSSFIYCTVDMLPSPIMSNSRFIKILIHRK